MAPAAAQKQRVVIDLRAVERVCGIVDADGVAEALGHDWVGVEIGGAAHVACHREKGRGRRSVSDDALLGCGYVCVLACLLCTVDHMVGEGGGVKVGVEVRT